LETGATLFDGQLDVAGRDKYQDDIITAHTTFCIAMSR